MEKFWKKNTIDGLLNFGFTLAYVLIAMISMHIESFISTDIILPTLLMCIEVYLCFHYIPRRSVGKPMLGLVVTIIVTFLISAYRTGSYGLFLVLEGIVVVSIPILAFFVANNKTKQVYLWYCTLAPILPCAFYIHI